MPSSSSRIWMMKSLRLSRRHVAAVRVEAHRDRAQEHFEQLVVVGLLPPLVDAAIPLVQLLLGLVVGHVVVGDLQQQVVLHPLAPPLVGFFLRRRSR